MAPASLFWAWARVKPNHRTKSEAAKMPRCRGGCDLCMHFLPPDLKLNAGSANWVEKQQGVLPEGNGACGESARSLPERGQCAPDSRCGKTVSEVLRPAGVNRDRLSKRC